MKRPLESFNPIDRPDDCPKPGRLAQSAEAWRKDGRDALTLALEADERGDLHEAARAAGRANTCFCTALIQLAQATDIARSKP